MRKPLLPLLLALCLVGCAAKKPVKPANLTFSEIAPRYCLKGDGPKWTPDSYCRKYDGQWQCYKMKGEIKPNCGRIDVAPNR